MRDPHIDHNETQDYGPEAAKQIRTVVVGLQPIFNPVLNHLADRIDTATTAVATAVSTARGHDATTRQTAQSKGPALEGAISVLGRFSKHLDTHDGGIDRKTFFVKDGTARGVGRSARRVQLALAHVRDELMKTDCPVHDSARWLNDVKDALSALGPEVEKATNTQTSRRMVTPEVEAARQEWLTVYRSAQSVVEGVLRLSGKLHLMKEVFRDLAVPAKAKAATPNEAPAAVSAPAN